MGRARLERGVARAGLGDRAGGLEDVRQARAEIVTCAGPDARIAIRARRQLDRLLVAAR